MELIKLDSQVALKTRCYKPEVEWLARWKLKITNAKKVQLSKEIKVPSHSKFVVSFLDSNHVHKFLCIL